MPKGDWTHEEAPPKDNASNPSPPRSHDRERESTHISTKKIDDENASAQDIAVKTRDKVNDIHSGEQVVAQALGWNRPSQGLNQTSSIERHITHHDDES
ncbi:hypothetical protein BGE01nite_04620 [Brevifollis gellanilyticus]|uniref:Uncharacterized protein n=1 Tax=Brevifollis gellanilyticus TaxID=748831 RepID=A0A512M4D2_9BACT|nr:hypothetical protein BGE01nite_04620 [Brevifollis gellanilyticus]